MLDTKDLGDMFHACCQLRHTQDEFCLLDELQLSLPQFKKCDIGSLT